MCDEALVQVMEICKITINTGSRAKEDHTGEGELQAGGFGLALRPRRQDAGQPSSKRIHSALFLFPCTNRHQCGVDESTGRSARVTMGRSSRRVVVASFHDC